MKMEFTLSAFARFARLTAVLALAFLLPAATAAPTTRSYRFPCGYDVPAQGRNLSQSLPKVKQFAADAAHAAEGLKNALSVKIGNTNVENLLMGMHINNLPHDLSNKDVSQKTAVLTSAYGDLSRHAIFFDQLRREEMNNRNQLTTTYVAMMAAIHDTLCEVSHALSFLGSPVTVFESETIMGDDIKFISSEAERNWRDFIVAKDGRQFAYMLESVAVEMMGA